MLKNARYFLFFFLPVLLSAGVMDWLDPVSDKAKMAQARFEGFDEVIEKAIRDFQAPGLGIGVVVDGQIVYAKGFGYRDLEKKLPVTVDTVFAIGSCTKAFTGFAMGTLVDDAHFNWDELVIDVLPEFRLYDPYATHHITMRDLMTHRSGMPRHDFMWYTSNMTRSEMMKKIRYLEPSLDLRERYQYNNLMYLTAACAMEAVTGKTWEEIVTGRILKPLEMKNTTFTHEEIQKAENFAYPYIEKNEKLKKIPFRNVGPVAPAASMNSTVADMCKWLQLNLNDGVYNNQTLISPATLQEIQTPQVIIPGAPESKESLIYAYGIGWGIASYRGHYYLSHDGGVDGFTSVAGVLPNDGVGIFIIVNKNLCCLCRFLSNEAIDRALGLPHIDWVKEGLQSYNKSKESQKETKLQEDLLRKKGTQPSHPLDDYVGTYEHPGYGKVAIENVAGRLQASFNNLTLKLDHWHYDVFSIAEESQDLIVSLEGTKFTFQNNLNGDIDCLTIPFEPNTNDIIFKRKHEGKLTANDYLRQFTGYFEIYGYTVEIALKNHTLVALIPGQPHYELVPIGEREFTVKGMNGYTVRFNMDLMNQVDEVLLVAPYGAFSAKPKKM